jgi:hypothetical protein
MNKHSYTHGRTVAVTVSLREYFRIQTSLWFPLFCYFEVQDQILVSCSVER